MGSPKSGLVTRLKVGDSRFQDAGHHGIPKHQLCGQFLDWQECITPKTVWGISKW